MLFGRWKREMTEKEEEVPAVSSPGTAPPPWSLSPVVSIESYLKQWIPTSVSVPKIRN